MGRLLEIWRDHSGQLSVPYFTKKKEYLNHGRILQQLKLPLRSILVCAEVVVGSKLNRHPHFSVQFLLIAQKMTSWHQVNLLTTLCYYIPLSCVTLS